jgi:DNA-directed RNA polymerase subunit RPC12/RpoP
MAGSRNPLSFESFRGRFGAVEEINVGAYARRQLRRRVLIGLVGTVLIAGAFALYHQLRARSAESVSDHYPVQVRCISCGHTATLQVRFAQSFPIECPACGLMACRPLWQCRDCGAQFVPEQVGTVVRCPDCGGQRVGSAAAPESP